VAFWDPQNKPITLSEDSDMWNVLEIRDVRTDMQRERRRASAREIVTTSLHAQLIAGGLRAAGKERVTAARLRSSGGLL
jgi:hypothetical protein